MFVCEVLIPNVKVYTFALQTTDIGCKGNLLLSRMVGSHVIVAPDIDYNCGLREMMVKMAEKL